jgi:galactose mutarotase-like enzyme
MDNYFASWEMEMHVDSNWAELTSLKVKWREYLYQKTPWFWQRQSPILFPIVGKLRNDSYEHAGRAFSIPQHGFSRDMEWEPVETWSQNELAFRINSTEQTREKYPWDFALEIRYIIEQTTLRVEYSVTNIGKESLPFSLGGHPAFHIEGPISDYVIEFDDDDGIIEHDILDQEQKGLISWHTGTLQLNNRVLRLSEFLFSLDAVIFKNLKSKKITLLKKGEKVFTFDRGNFPHFALWKQPNAPFLCFEPWQGFADDVKATGKIHEKPGIFWLKRGKTKSFDWSIEIPK